MSAGMISENEIQEFRRTGKKFIKEWKVHGINPAIRWKEIVLSTKILETVKKSAACLSTL